MPKNQLIIEYKPKNGLVFEPKPVNQGVFEAKPKLEAQPSSALTDQLYDSTINVGEPMGLLLSLTYPNTFTFKTTFHP